MGNSIKYFRAGIKFADRSLKGGARHTKWTFASTKKVHEKIMTSPHISGAHPIVRGLVRIIIILFGILLFIIGIPWTLIKAI